MEFTNPQTEQQHIAYVTPTDEKDERLFRCTTPGVKLELDESLPFVEWIAEKYLSFGAKLEFITDESQEGHQFCKAFGGIGGLLRYPVKFDNCDQQESQEEDSDEDFM